MLSRYPKNLDKEWENTVNFPQPLVIKQKRDTEVKENNIFGV